MAMFTRGLVLVLLAFALVRTGSEASEGKAVYSARVEVGSDLFII
jgi:hypothetical protein